MKVYRPLLGAVVLCGEKAAKLKHVSDASAGAICWGPLRRCKGLRFFICGCAALASVISLSTMVYEGYY